MYNYRDDRKRNWIKTIFHSYNLLCTVSSGGQTNVPRRDVTSRRRDELAIGILVNVSSQAGETRRDETTQPKSNPCPTREFGELRELVYFIFSYFISVCWHVQMAVHSPETRRDGQWRDEQQHSTRPNKLSNMSWSVQCPVMSLYHSF